MARLRALTGWPFDVAAAVALAPIAYVQAPHVPLARALAVAMCLAVAFRSRAPIPALAVPAFASLASTALGYLPPNGAGYAALQLCLYSVAATYPARVSAVIALIIAAGGVYVTWSMGLLGMAFTIAAVACNWFIARDLRTRRELVAVLRERAASAEQRVAADERARIAREVHDVVSHTVAVIAVQAGAARRMLDSDPDQAKVALAAVEKTARDALHDLRTLLDVLRPSAGGDRRPQPGLDRLPELMESFARAGLEIQSRIEVGEPLPAAADVSVFRIVQEALTNCLRHAGGAPVSLDVTRDGDTVEIGVHNGPGEAAPDANGAGRGLEGMRQRVKMFAGQMSAGPAEDGGWTVTVRLPVEASRT